MANVKDIALQNVISTMNLRTPQQEALENLHAVFSSTETPLKDLSAEELMELFRQKYSGWDFGHEATEFTFHLATGVGKTRLIGAVMAYLHLSGQSSNFLIVSPRSEIIRKFKNVSTREDEKYLFVDPSLIDFPTVFDADSSVSEFDNRMFDSSLRLWIISPQAFTASGSRLKKRSENDAKSVVEYLTELDDLVVFFDESHHLGFNEEEDSVWRTELNALKPKMIVGTTASVSDGQNNVMYSYDLKKCLNEHLYTKFVRIIPDKRSETVSDEDYDHLTLRFALQRLELKQKCLDNYCELNGLKRRVKAAMLVACENIDHAEKTTQWLRNYLGSREAVLPVHSGMKDSDYLPQLKSVEDPTTPEKVIINVSMLNEGWDVENIYVIAPLRAMASTTLVTQIMGRGLRLPFGRQVGDEEVDTLDVLCFGRETMQEIVNHLMQEGFGTGANSGITVDPKDNTAHPDDEFVPKKKIFLNVVKGETELQVPQFKMNKAPLPIEQVSIPALKETELRYFLINDLTTNKRLGGGVEFGRDEFIGIVTTDVLKQCKYLSFGRHHTKVKQLVERFLKASRFTGDTVRLDPVRVIDHIVKSLNELNSQQEVHYEQLPEVQKIDLEKVQVAVPETYQHPSDNRLLDWREWETRKHKNIPFGGWNRCIYEAVPFDTGREFHIAQIIDMAEEVKAWLRNLPGIITLSTPVGGYSPDFAIFLNLDDKTVLLELKDDDRFGREDQDATIKANAARAWCKAQTEATGKLWDYWLLLDSDARECETFDDICNCVEI